MTVENFRPGVMDRLGFALDTLTRDHPRLVILSISGFGIGGPDGYRPGYDQIMQGEAGLMSITGSLESGPTKVGVPIAELLAGLHGAYGERSRERAGRWLARSPDQAVISTPRSALTDFFIVPILHSRSPSAAKICGGH